jgi:hypothetical protein
VFAGKLLLQKLARKDVMLSFCHEANSFNITIAIFSMFMFLKSKYKSSARLLAQKDPDCNLTIQACAAVAKEP